jgi:ankyrin repeat protein
MSSEWGPPGFETPTSFQGSRRLLAAAAFGLTVAIGVPWCQNTFGYFNVLTGRRLCAAAPSEIHVWMLHDHTRRPEEAVNLQKWIARNPRRIKKQYGAFCDTPLDLAARFGREDFADALIAAGADVEAPNKLHERPLHISAAYGHPAVVRLLLARGADVNATDPWGKTPLHSATYGLGTQSNIAGRLEVAKLLLAAGANVNARARNGFAPLRSATSYESRNPDMAALLLSYGADPGGADEQYTAERVR